MLIDTIMSLLRGDHIEIMDFVVQILATMMILFLVIPIHEFAHGWMANKLGDPTARLAGRLTLNPLASIDPMGAAALLLVGFGWGRPVPVDSRYFKNYRTGIAMTALAGPTSNLIAAFAGYFLTNVITFIWSFFPGDAVWVWYILMFLDYFCWFSIILAVFNLFPVPPLDGSKILMSFLPDRARFWMLKNQNFLMLGGLILLYSDVLDKPLSLIASGISFILSFVSDLPFMLIYLIMGV